MPKISKNYYFFAPLGGLNPDACLCGKVFNLFLRK
nr:MAG TPA: hypothetical protein [Caudoviricetes sp.]